MVACGHCSEWMKCVTLGDVQLSHDERVCMLCCVGYCGACGHHCEKMLYLTLGNVQRSHADKERHIIDLSMKNKNLQDELAVIMGDGCIEALRGRLSAATSEVCL